uniref:Uncharacterized protein n=1 Tax=Leersia perrieri TaxID=77586 RepID=A0A0D9X2Z2_9ORYZ
MFWAVCFMLGKIRHQASLIGSNSCKTSDVLRPCRLMAISDARVVRHVRCPRCFSVLQEPSGAPVYQCGGCGTNLKAKIRTGSSQEVISAPSYLGNGLLPPQSKHLGSSDVASTSGSTPEAPITRDDMMNRRETDDLVSAKNNSTEQVLPIEDEQVQSTSQQAVTGNSEDFTRGDAATASAQCCPRSSDNKTAPSVATEKKKATSPPHVHARHHHQSSDESLAPLQKKILKTVDNLKDELSELFSKSPELNKPTRTTRQRPPRLPRREGHPPRDAAALAAAAASLHATIRARHAAAHVAPPPRGLPSRRYRRCRADPQFCHHHGCCCAGAGAGGGKQACSSCRGHCCRRPRTQQPPAAAAGKEVVKRRAPPRNHCRPVLKGAPFIVCSTCFRLVQVPADFAVFPTKAVRKLRCGSCSAVLCYSYRDPDRKKSVSAAASPAPPRRRRDPFAFMDDFVDVSYSTEDDQPLHVSRNSSFNTVADERSSPAAATARLHRLMGYGSASDLLFRQHSPDLYESFSERTTPDVFAGAGAAAAAAKYDRKGKGICLEFDDGDDDDDDSDEDFSGKMKKSKLRGGSAWPLPGFLNKGMPGMGAIRIKS